MPLPIISFVYGFFLPESPIYVKVQAKFTGMKSTGFPDQENKQVDPETEDQPLVARDGEIQGSWRNFLSRRWVKIASKKMRGKLEPDEAIDASVPQLPTIDWHL